MEYGEKGVYCLISDFINLEVLGFIFLEKLVYLSLDWVLFEVVGCVMLIIFVFSVYRL